MYPTPLNRAIRDASGTIEVDPATHVDIVIDLSGSMDSELGFDTPISQAKELASWLVAGLLAAGATVDVYGGIDAGNIDVQLLQLNTPLSPSIQTLHPMGLGGFRAGAMIRSLIKQSEQGRPPNTNRYVFLTDGTPIYLRLAVRHAAITERQRELCPSCPLNWNCPYEPGSDGTAQRQLFLNNEIAMLDVHNAAKEIPLLWIELLDHTSPERLVQQVHSFFKQPHVDLRPAGDRFRQSEYHASLNSAP